jgi:hypothetical protein
MEAFDITGLCAAGAEGACLEPSHLMWRMGRRLPPVPGNDMRRVYVYIKKDPGGAGKAEHFMDTLKASAGE